jgi:hypothetical protein
VTTNALSDYGRYTPTDSAASKEYAERLAERVEALRGAAEAEGDDAESGEIVGEGAVARHPVSELGLGTTRNDARKRLVLDSNGNPHWVRSRRPRTIDEVNPSLTLNADRDDDRPVVVEEVQIRDEAGFTRRATVVRQGDRILSVVKGPKHHFSPRDFVDESELEE